MKTNNGSFNQTDTTCCLPQRYIKYQHRYSIQLTDFQNVATSNVQGIYYVKYPSWRHWLLTLIIASHNRTSMPRSDMT